MSSTTVTDTAEPRTSQQAVSMRRVAVGLGAAVFVTMIPVTMLVPVLRELIAVRYDADRFWTHSFMSVNMIGAILAAPLIGFWSDRPGSRRVVAALALAADSACLAAMSVMPALWAILAVRLVEGAAHILALTTLMAIAADWAPEGRRGRMMGVIGACMMLGTACGTRIGGVVGREWPDATFLVAAAVALLAAALVGVLVRESAVQYRRRRRLRDVTALLKRRGALLVPLAYAFVDRLCVGVIITTFVLFLGEVRGLHADAISRLLLAFLLPFSLLVYPAGRLVDRFGRIGPIALGSAFFGAAFAGYGFAGTAWMWALMPASGVLGALMFAPSMALCVDLAPPEQRGAAYAAFNAAGSLGMLLGPLAGGALLAAFGAIGRLESAYQAVFVVVGAFQLACAAATLPILLRLRTTGLTR